MNQTPTGPDAEVREALATAVQSYGPAVLGNAQMLGNILTDLLPDHPRERSLLVAAAEAEAATLLQEQVGHQRLDAGTAVAQTARTLMERRALDPTAARWVTTAYATALGYNPPPAEAVPPGQAGAPPADALPYVPTQPIGSVAPPQTPSMPPGLAKPVQPGLPDAPTLIGAPQSSSLPPTSRPNYPPPAGVPPTYPPPGYGGASQGFGPPGSGTPTTPLPPYGGGPGLGGMPMGGPAPGKRPVGLIIAAAAVAVVLVGYFAIAGAAHLPPFHAAAASQSTTPPPSPSPTPVPTTPTPIPSPTGPVLADGVTPIYTILGTTLADPATQCVTATDQPFTAVGLVSAYHCTDTALPGGGIWAYQMDSQADYQSTWVNFNKWWGFDASTAGGTCPPPSGGNGEGLSQWHNDAVGYPDRSGQVLECEMVGTGSNANQPAYTWTLPTQNAFISAQGASGSSWSALNTWWEKYAPPGATAAPTSS